MVETSQVHASAKTAFTHALSSSGLDSLCCSWFEFQAKMFEDVSLKLKKKKKTMTPPNIETARNKCVETCMPSKQSRPSHDHVTLAVNSWSPCNGRNRTSFRLQPLLCKLLQPAARSIQRSTRNPLPTRHS